MKKIFILTTSMMLLVGCVETVALLGPASSVLGGGNVVHSSISSAASFGVKKTTGKSPMQHALAFVEENNPDRKKDRCISFVKQTESEACYIAKKKISAVTKSTTKKVNNLLISSKFEMGKNKKILTKKNQSTLKVELEKEYQLKSVESIIIESVKNKKQISHLSASIKKNYKTKDLSK
mgnify:CR=1 FL=1|tara:strand:+ start:348 stop:884 length:537 start_codon:yes stop_codon:yes gene_type:complete